MGLEHQPVTASVDGDGADSEHEHMYHQRPDPIGPAADPFKHYTAGVRRGGMLSCVLAACAILVLCRVARTWNRTGDKWAHLPDIGDWLVMWVHTSGFSLQRLPAVVKMFCKTSVKCSSPENKPVLSVLCVVSLALTWVCQLLTETSTLGKILFVPAAVAVYLFRAANGAVLLPVFYDEGNVSKYVDVLYSRSLMEKC